MLTTNVLPKLAPTPSTQQPKVASLLVPISLPGQVTPATTKGGMINLKISNGQIQTENKGCITGMIDVIILITLLIFGFTSFILIYYLSYKVLNL